MFVLVDHGVKGGSKVIARGTKNEIEILVDQRHGSMTWLTDGIWVVNDHIHVWEEDRYNLGKNFHNKES